MLREECTFTAPLTARYLLQAPDAPGPGTLAAVTLHGYGSEPSSMLRLTDAMLGPGHVVAALEGPNQFFRAPDSFDSETVHGWGARRDPAASVRLHHEMVSRVLEELRQRFLVPPERCLLVGFSQPVAMNYRFIATHPDEVRGVVAICGGLPRDWVEHPPARLRPAVLYLAASEDPYYPPDAAQGFAARLHALCGDAEFHLLPGGHRVPSQAATLVRPWLERVFPSAARVGS